MIEGEDVVNGQDSIYLFLPEDDYVVIETKSVALTEGMRLSERYS